MQTSEKKSVLSLDILVVVRSHRSAEDPRLSTEQQLRKCEDLGAQIAGGAARQLIACSMENPMDWLRHRALVFGYVCGMSEAGCSARWAAALSCLNALSLLLGPDSEEGALCKEAQRLRDQAHPGYLRGMDAAREDRTSLEDGNEPTALARAIVDREMTHG